jgi:5-methylcytosine-specific restriction endonuclease McrA
MRNQGDFSMPTPKVSNGHDSLRQTIAEARQVQKQREKSYREMALKMFSHVCGRCSREFSGKKLRELTVHHRDHNHDHNPSDGSNWELLCIYCHENEHSRYLEQDAYGGQAETQSPKDPGSSHRPFSGLAALLQDSVET